MKDTDADTITGVIHHINKNKGILKMRCGVEVSRLMQKVLIYFMMKVRHYVVF